MMVRCTLPHASSFCSLNVLWNRERGQSQEWSRRHTSNGFRDSQRNMGRNGESACQWKGSCNRSEQLLHQNVRPINKPPCNNKLMDNNYRLDQLFKTAKITPAVNQVEYVPAGLHYWVEILTFIHRRLHPYLAQPELKAYCDAKGIVLTAYTPTGYATVRSDPTIVELAKKYNVTPAQVILAWHLSRGVVVVPKSSNEQHQKENLAPPTLSKEDLEAIGKLDRNERLCNKANERGIVWGWTYEQLGW